MRRVIACVAVAIGLSLTGCGTIANFKADPEIYGGMKTDADLAADLFAKGKAPPEPGADVRTVAKFFALAAIMDLPLSALADTLALPLTIPIAIVNSLDRDDEPVPPVAAGKKERK